MDKEVKMVEEFHNAFGHPVHDEPKMLSASRATFRHTLLQEEVTELLKASMRGDVVEVADGIARHMNLDLVKSCRLFLRRCTDPI